jgi:hypothetical protein
MRARRTLFGILADRWERETSLLSSPTAKSAHPDYRRIIELGPNVVPMILQRMSKKGGHWFWALSAITKANPVSLANRGNIPAMRKAWLKWGKAHGYC